MVSVRQCRGLTHGQSAAVFGLAYLLGIELMPRIRRWQSLTLYRSDNTNRYSKINSLFSGTVTSKLKRFGDYPTDLKPEAMPTCTTLPQ